MMKTLLGILYLTLFCAGTMAQNTVNSTQSLVNEMRSTGELFSWSVASGEVSGSPYLTEEFQSSMIYWNREWNEGIDLRFNIYQGSFEAKLEKGIIVIDPIKNNIDTLKYREEVFVKKYLNEDNKLLVVFLSMLGEQNGYTLYKQYRVTLSEAVTDTDLYHKAKPAEYVVQSPVYYVFKGNEHWTVKGSKTLAEVFQVDAKVVKSYLKDNKYKLSNEEHLLAAVLYFSGSNAQ